MTQSWMVRAGHGGRHAEEFRDHGIVAIGWSELGDLTQYADRASLLEPIEQMWPDWPDGRKQTSAGQLLRFQNEPEIGDRVITYDPGRRIYLVGTIKSSYRYLPDVVSPLDNARETLIYSPLANPYN